MTVPCARGCVEDWAQSADVVHFGGWMGMPGVALDSFRARLSGADWVPLEALERPDVHEDYPMFPRRSRLGFRGMLELVEGRGGWRLLEVIGCVGDNQVARLAVEIPGSFGRAVTAPPQPLMLRVARISSPTLFRLDGLRSTYDLLQAVKTYRSLRDIASVLDFGCGCGRVLSPLSARVPHLELSGCDVDREAIHWCREQHPGAAFQVIQRLPPAPYDSESFDLVLAYSVFTHLTRDAQLEWLTECRRILRPGGLLVASVHGARALELSANPKIRAGVEANGISDDTVDDSLAGILPADAYRAVFQSAEWTAREWGAVLPIRAILPAAAGGFHDLVVAGDGG